MLFEDLAIQTNKYEKGQAYSQKVTIFVAKKIITMANEIEEAEAVAVFDGKILAVGLQKEVEEALRVRGLTYELDKRFQEQIILPGFIEAHMHVQYAGVNLNHVYVGYFDRYSPEGQLIKGCTTIEDILARLKETYEANPDKYDDKNWLNAYGIDPLVLGNVDLNSKLLDTVTTKVPICINHASGHLLSINTLAIELSGVDKIDDPGIGRFPDGTCNGNIAETENMKHVLKVGGMGISGDPVEISCRATYDAARVAQINGCTTITDKAFGFPMVSKSIEGYQKMQEGDPLATRLVVEPFLESIETSFGGWDGLAKLRKEMENDMFIFGNTKLLVDGSIQGYTANLLAQEYWSGVPNGHLIATKEEIIKSLEQSEDYGYSISIHTNGNGATETAIQAIEERRKQKPSNLFRHSLEHNQLVTENQLYRMNQNNITSNFFINHIYYWGDVHSNYTAGPHEVKRMNPLRSALDHDLRFSVHSDYPVTEVNPLFSAWVACNRKAAISGNVYGEDQCLTVKEALRLITINAAWLLQLEDYIGSIEVGKWADFTVLAEEPTEENKANLKDIKIVATVLGGKVQEIN